MYDWEVRVNRDAATSYNDRTSCALQTTVTAPEGAQVEVRVRNKNRVGPIVGNWTTWCSATASYLSVAPLPLAAEVANATPIQFAWDRGPGWPAGTTVELCSNGVCADGITATLHTLDVPVTKGDMLDAKARAIPPTGYQCGEPPEICPPSEWVTLSGRIPFDVTDVVVNIEKLSSPPVTIWPETAVPANPDINDPRAVELGVKFRADVSGAVTGIRFYKGSGNLGVHVGNLWTSTGTKLATATFTEETASGWQQVNFTTPVAIDANTVYVASYFAPSGNYAGDNFYFSAAGADNPPLQALKDDVAGGNGVFVYGARAFPNQTWKSSNYWVDIVFVPAGDDRWAGGDVISRVQSADYRSSTGLVGNPDNARSVFLEYVGKASDGYVWPARGGKQGGARQGWPAWAAKANVLATGQIECWQGEPPWDEIDCAGTGQEGEYQMGVKPGKQGRFKDKGDGTVEDLLTGLIWLKDANCFGPQLWQGALEAANALAAGQCGLTDKSTVGDWRLPNINELHSLVDRGFVDPALSKAAGDGQWTEGDAFSGVQSAFYWSSTSYVDYPGYAWGLDLYYGGDYFGWKTDGGYVWPVRGGK